MKIKELFKLLKNTSSRNEKESILKHYDGDKELLKEIFYYTYNTLEFNFFIKKIPEVVRKYYSFSIERNFDTVTSLLKKFIDRELTGNSAINELQKLLESFDEEDSSIIIGIINRDQKLGISISTINTIWPGLIPVYDVVLAQKYDDKTKKIVDSNWFISHKLDGVRTVVDVSKKEVKTCGRSGKLFSTCKLVEDELFDSNRTGEHLVFDGELCVLDEDGNENFQGIMKEVKRKDYTIKNPMFIIFDCLTASEFYSGKSTRTLSERLDFLKKHFSGNHKYFKILEQIPYTNESFEVMKKTSKDKNWEGLMLRKNTTYENGRTKDLLKYKLFQDAEYVVKDIEVGPFTKTTSGVGQETIECVTTIFIEHRGNKVGVGSGMSIQQRIDWKNDPSLIIGKTITVKYFEETKNENGNYSLRFPTLKYIFDGERDV